MTEVVFAFPILIARYRLLNIEIPETVQRNRFRSQEDEAFRNHTSQTMNIFHDLVAVKVRGEKTLIVYITRCIDSAERKYSCTLVFDRCKVSWQMHSICMNSCDTKVNQRTHKMSRLTSKTTKCIGVSLLTIRCDHG